MVDIFYAIPTADAAKCSSTFARWKSLGYRTAALIDGDTLEPENCDLCLRVKEYRGWPWATNLLLNEVLKRNPVARWCIAGGDDMDPSPDADPQEIAAECENRFGGTFGVMQPTGDPFGVDASGRCAAERICGSPWLGREFIEKWNRGAGPFDERFFHFYADELLKRQVEACGLLWQRKDLTHFHHHPIRTGAPAPAYMDKAKGRWSSDQAKFFAMERAGFSSEIRDYIAG